jgi:xylulokinase
MKYLLGIDFGGGASKATLLDTVGNIVGESTAEYPTLYPQNGACEQDPKDWIGALCVNTQTLLKNSGIDSKDILAIAIDSATHTSVVCDEAYKPLRNAIHWTDSRSRQQADRLRESCGEKIFEKAYHKPDTIWTLPQLLWLKENESELFGKIRYIFFEKDYIRYFLTGVFCTDYIEAQGSMLFDCNCMQWDGELCALAGIAVDMLPPVVKPTDIIGKVMPGAAKKTGLQVGTPVICGTTDTVLEVFAAGAVKPGDMTVKLATAGRICVITEKAYPDRHLVNYSHICDGLWYPGTATKAAAASYRWYRDTFSGDYATLNEGAEQIRIGCDGLMYHPYINGELTPYADPMLCGSFTGIRATHTKAHFTRAVLEGVCYSMLDCLNYLDSLQIPYGTVATAIGGGTKGMLWLQMLSDVLGITLRTTLSGDSSLGSAMLAGIAVGVFADATDAVSKCVKEKDVVYPNSKNTEEYRKLFAAYKKIHDALAPVYQERAL